MNPLQDTSTGTSSLPYAALRSIKSQLQDLLLHDSWRTLNPNNGDFTFFSVPHNWYSRIDYLFISQNDLPLLKSTFIDPMFLLDHHPIFMTISFPEIHDHPQSWRLNPSLLTDPSIAEQVKLCIKQYFTKNKATDPLQSVTTVHGKPTNA